MDFDLEELSGVIVRSLVQVSGLEGAEVDLIADKGLLKGTRTIISLTNLLVQNSNDMLLAISLASATCLGLELPIVVEQRLVSRVESVILVKHLL